MKIIQLNMWLGHLLDPALKFLKQEDPDVLCAQEIFSTSIAMPIFNNLQTHQRLCDLFPYQFFAPTYGFTVLDASVELGNAIYSKYPLHETSTHFTNGQFTRSQTLKTYEQENVRNLQRCTVDLPSGKSLSIANHHGFHDVDPNGTTDSARAMSKAADTLRTPGPPLIFCGDLNVNPTSTALHQLDSLGLRNLIVESGATTTLSPMCRLTDNVVCDYIFVTPSINVNTFQVSEQIVSDHKALILEYSV